MSRDLVETAVEVDLAGDLFTWDDLNEMLMRGDARPAELKLAADGAEIDPSSYTVTRGSTRVLDIGAVQAHLRNGASLIIDSLDRIHARVRRATDDVMRLVGEPTSCNLFVTFHRSQAFVSHFDEVDTLILQIAGEKSWRVHGVSEPDPLPEYGDSDPAKCPDRLLLDRVLQTGDLLHVPRGWWHTVRGADAPSMHLTFAFTRPTTYDYVRWILRRALHDPALREGLVKEGTAASRADQVRRVRAALLTEFDSSTLDEFIAQERRFTGMRPASSLPLDVMDVDIDADATVTFLPIVPPTWREGDAGQVALEIGGQDYALPAAVVPCVRLLEREREITFNTLTSALGLESAVAQRVVTALVRVGLARVH